MLVLRFAFNLVIFSLPAVAAGFAAFRLAKSSRDEWQLLAWVPVLPLAIWGVFIAWGVTRDPTSHNLWPFELVAWGVLSALLFVVVRIARRISGNDKKV